MNKRTVSSLIIFGIAVVVIVAGATGVEAGCKRLQPRGPYICASWITGSEVCDLVLKGLKGNIAEGAWIQCGVYGTYYSEYPTEEGEYQEECDPSSGDFVPSLGCDITGKAACYNPQGHYNELGTAFNLPGPLYEVATQATCDKGGKCTTSAEVDVQGNGGVCNRNWSLTFTAERFFGQICVCPGGFANNGDCCLDDKRQGNACKTQYNEGEDIGEPDCLTEYCEYDGDFFADYTFGEGLMGSYSCFETNPG